MKTELQRGFAALMRRLKDAGRDQLTMMKAPIPGQVQVFLDDDLWWQTWKQDLANALSAITATGSALGVQGARRQIEGQVKWDLLLEGTKAWAEQHAGELVTGLADSLKQKIRSAITNSMVNGETWKETSDRIMTETGLNQWRAERIARTETIRAYTQGEVASYQASGTVRGLRWLSGQAGACPTCQELNGKEIPLGGRFYDDPSFGDGLTPRHPHCRCAIAPITVDEAARLSAENPLSNRQRNSIQELTDRDTFTEVNGIIVGGDRRRHWRLRHGSHFNDIDQVETRIEDLLTSPKGIRTHTGVKMYYADWSTRSYLVAPVSDSQNPRLLSLYLKEKRRVDKWPEWSPSK